MLVTLVSHIFYWMKPWISHRISGSMRGVGMAAPGGGNKDEAYFCISLWLPLSMGMQMQKTPYLSSHPEIAMVIRFRVSPLVVSTSD